MTDHEAVVMAEAPKIDGRLLRRTAFRAPILGLIAAPVIAGIILLRPEPAGLPPEGKRMAAIFLVALILWATEALPIAVTALLVIILQPIFRVEELRTAFNAFMSPVFFFVIASFCLAEAIISSGLDRRFALWLLSRAGTDSRRVILAFIVGTAAISTISFLLGLLDSVRPNDPAHLPGLPVRPRTLEALDAALVRRRALFGVRSKPNPDAETPATDAVNITFFGFTSGWPAAWR